MEKIGDFAKRCEVTIKTLRYYDELGLLVPDYIDKFTSYRYYGPGKVDEMRRITELKDIGFTLEEIKRYCDADNDAERNKIIEEKHWSLKKLAEDTALQLTKLKAIKQNLQRGEKKMQNIFDAPFENDERVIGRWEIIASVETKEDFKPAKIYNNIDTPFEEIYFLPDGQQYWGFSWTKGYLKITFGDGLFCPYELVDFDGKTYMFIHQINKNLGQSPIWVLIQTDAKRYTKYEIGQHDNIDLPFVDDPDVIGKWTSVDFVREIEDFDPVRGRKYDDILYFETTEFLPDGQLKKQYEGKDIVFNCKWTKGKVLIKNGDGTTAPAYEIRNIDGEDYLFYEWKSGDYIWGKRKPCYYVFKRD